MGLLATLLGISEDELVRIRRLAKQFLDLEDKQRGQQRQLDDLVAAFRRRIDKDADGAYNDVLCGVLAKIDTEQLVADTTKKIQELLEKAVQKAAEDIVKNTDLADRIWEAIDEDALKESFIEAFAENARFEAWLKESTGAIAEAIAEYIHDDVDWDELKPEIGEAIARRLEWVE
jgi:predicted transcriptional regulator